jgi:gluconokinase
MFILIMGVAGSGKTTVGTLLASTLGWSFVDADDLHSPENVRKMAAGIPLTDEDRRPWLADLCDVVSRYVASGENLVLACSALKGAYRDVFASAAPGMATIYLQADPILVRGRLGQRRGHYMPPALLESQFEALQEPADALTIPAAWPPDQIVTTIRATLAV